MTPEEIVSDLTYINYAHNRKLSPEVTPERWAKIYPCAAAMEARYQRELLDSANRQTMKLLDIHFEREGGCFREDC